MDEFARLASDERQPYFVQAAAQRGLTAQLIEKDFWVCWSLRRLFSLTEFRDHLTFKGGTSLSKVYQAIERFSEDVDVAIERGSLGFGGDNDPEKGASGKEQQRRIDALSKACQVAIAERMMPQLNEAITASLGGDTSWTLSLDLADADRQSLLFQYPPAISGGLSPYVAPSVKFEFGARSDHFPVEDVSVTPYVAEEFPDAFPENKVHVRALAAARTFWEKVTILHMLHHQPSDKSIAPQMSRHYYDVFCLSQGPVLDEALATLNLLDRVAAFKRVYFKAASARYEEARPGTLRLIPGEQMAKQLTRDYEDMRHMFFSEPPPFQQILDFLHELETRINEIDRGD